MTARGDLGRFVGDALSAGRGRVEIRAALVEAGWRPRDVDRALAGYADVPFVPPVPRPRPFVSARDAVIYALAFFALAAVVVNAVSASFDAIEALTSINSRLSARDQAWRIAAVVVFAPLFVALDWRSETDNPVRKVFAYAALFVAALTVLFTLVGVIALALSGGLGAEVLLKALCLALAAGLVLLYYRRDLMADTER